MLNKKIFIALAILALFINLHANWSLQHSGGRILYGIDFPPGQFNNGYACGASSFCLRTTDGGATWTACTTQVAGEYRDIDFPVDYLTGYLFGDLGLVAKTTDAGSIWALGNITVSQQTYAGQFPGQDQIGFVCAAEGYFAVTYDGGMSYNLIQIQPPQDLYDVSFLNPEFGFVVGASGSIYNCYGTPELISLTSPTSEALYGVYMLEDGSAVWIVGANAVCYKSTDLGTSWNRVNLPIPTNIQLNAVVFPNSLTGYICGNSGKILKTTDGGTNWDTTSVEGGENLNDIVFPSGAEEGWVCGSGEAIYSTHVIGVGEAKSIPKPPAVFSANPNPFRAITSIKFSHPLANNPAIKIYDRSGALVRTLSLTANGNTNWDGRNDLNQKVKSGVYLLQATAKYGFVQRLKLVLLD